MLVVVAGQTAETPFGWDEADVVDRHRPAEVQHTDLSEHGHPVDEAMEDKGPRLQDLVEIGDDLPRLLVLHQRQARDRHVVLRRRDPRVTESVDEPDVLAHEAPTDREELAVVTPPRRRTDVLPLELP